MIRSRSILLILKVIQLREETSFLANLVNLLGINSQKSSSILVSVKTPALKLTHICSSKVERTSISHVSEANRSPYKPSF